MSLLVPWPFAFCLAVYPVVFVPFGFKNWTPLQQRAILAHEIIHHRQQKKLGLLRFCFYYAVSKRFRWRIEQSGYRRQLWILSQEGVPIDQNHWARILSGPLYWQMVDYATAQDWLKQCLVQYKYKV